VAEPESPRSRTVTRGARVSVVVPAFNAAPFFAECLASIVEQDPAPFEVIVVDDASTDATVEIALSFGPPVRVVAATTLAETPKTAQPAGPNEAPSPCANVGPAAARNAGVAASRGDFVAFLDADDLWLPGKLRRQLDLFEAQPDTDLCVTWVQNFWVPELAAEAERYRDHPMSKPYGGYCVHSCMARREVFTRFARFDETMRHGENMAWFEACVGGGAVLREIPEVFARRRLHSANMTRTEAVAAHDALFSLVKSRLDRVRRTPQ
jgi:glycosyltransferase involved in cell wall biosynthesis